MSLTAALVIWTAWAIVTWLGVTTWWRRHDARVREDSMPRDQETQQIVADGRDATQAWVREHADHGEIEELDSTFNGQRCLMLVCECGASLVRAHAEAA